MKLITTSIYSSISQGLTIIAGLITVKIVATEIGPGGMAMVGQFANVTSILLLFAGTAISTGVIKYLSEFGANPQYQEKIIRNAFWLTVLGFMIITTLVLIFSKQIADFTFKDQSLRIVIVIWGSLVIFISLSNLFNSIFNGLKKIGILTLGNIISTLLGLGITVLMVKQFGIKGVLLAQSIVGVLLFFVNLYLFRNLKRFAIRPLLNFKLDKDILHKFSGFFLMSLVAGILTPFFQFFIRNQIIIKLGMTDAGYWQAVTRISDYYLGFITTVLAVYYLPKISELKNKRDVQLEILQGYKIILPLVAALTVAIWLLRHVIIKLVLTSEFLPAEQLFGVQFIGDIFKIGSWLMSYILVAKAFKFAFIGLEIGFHIFYGLITFFLINQFGLIGSVYGFAVSYFFYWITVYVVLKKQDLL